VKRKAARGDESGFQRLRRFSPEDVQAVVNKARGEQGGNLNLYNRFFLHSLDDEQYVLSSRPRGQCLPGDCLYMEFRCSLDAKLDKLFKGHFRRYVDTGKLAMLEENSTQGDVQDDWPGNGQVQT
jgi:hypothetical protein